MRVLTAVDKNEHQFLEDASTEIWREIWSKDTDITQDSILTEVKVLKIFQNHGSILTHLRPLSFRNFYICINLINSITIGQSDLYQRLRRLYR